LLLEVDADEADDDPTVIFRLLTDIGIWASIDGALIVFDIGQIR